MLLLEKICFDHSYPSRFWFSANLRRVRSRGNRRDEGGFKIIARLQADALKFLRLLRIAPPIIVLFQDRAILVP